MTKIQLGSGSASSSTHHLTQSSKTLNRRYVERPTDRAIEEAARSVHSRTASSSAAPSRLVNLRVHASDLAQITTEPAQAAERSVAVVPKVIELGNNNQEDIAEIDTYTDDTTYEIEEAPTMVDFSQMVPEEAAPMESEPVSYVPALRDNSGQNIPTTSTDIASYDYANYYNNGLSVPAEAYENNYTEENYYDNGNTTMAIPANIAEDDTQALAMNIAADYAAANLGASMQTANANNQLSTMSADNNSVDAIAQAASNAIASIRAATDPEEVAEQVASLQTFADNIKATSAAPEMLELSDTIEKFVNVAMKSSKVQEEVQKKVAIKRDTASAKPKSESISIAGTKRKTTTTRPVASAKRRVVTPSKTSVTANKSAAKSRPLLRRNTRTATTPKINAAEEQALRKALRSVEDEPETKTSHKKALKRSGGGKRFALAFCCAIACVAGVVYMVGSNIPDISVKVAAMQTGIEASYPSYVPRDFSLSDISSEDGKITLTFKGPERTSFVLIEEKSSWDSTTLLRNYVEPNWQSNYTTTHEQGITIYISGANAAWVNGGVLYKIEASSNSLTSKQLRNIVVSL